MEEMFDVIETFLDVADSPHIAESQDTSTLEGLFFDEKKPPKWLVKNRGLVEDRVFRDGGVCVLTVPSNNWEKEFFIKNPTITEGLKKNGAKFLKAYLTILEQAYNHYMKIKSDWMTEDSDSTRKIELANEFSSKYFSKMAMLNREADATLSGIPSKADKNFLAQITPLMAKVKKLISDAATEYLEVRMLEIQKSSIKRTFNTRSVREVKSTYYIPLTIFAYAQDIWAIISNKSDS